AFFCFQCWLTAIVAFDSHWTSCRNSVSVTVAKYLSPFGIGRPNGFNKPAFINSGMSYGLKPRKFAASSLFRRAGSVARFRKSFLALFTPKYKATPACSAPDRLHFSSDGFPQPPNSLAVGCRQDSAHADQ